MNNSNKTIYSVTEPAPAKVNLTLDVTGVRPNGYHDVAMVMQSISLQDEISMSRREDNEVVLEFADTEVLRGVKLSSGPDNLVCKAVRKFWEYVERGACSGNCNSESDWGSETRAKSSGDGCESEPKDETEVESSDYGCDSKILNESAFRGVNILLTKHIPLEAGMAGGSTDAAATLRALNRLFGTGFDTKTLCEIGAGIGADVPFCVLGGTALAEGIGEILTPLTPVPKMDMLLVKPPVGASTKDIYNGLVLDETTEHPDNEAMIHAIEEADVDSICTKLSNVLEPVTIGLLPVIGDIKQKMLELGADAALMSGSGSTVFGIFKDKRKLEGAKKHFCKNTAYFCEVCTTLNS